VRTNGPAWLQTEQIPADAVFAPGGAAFASAVAALASQLETTRLALGTRVLGAQDGAQILEALASLASRYDFVFEASIDPRLPAELVRQLACAGVRRVRIAAPLGAHVVSGNPRLASPDIAMLRSLAEQHVHVLWDLALDDAGPLATPALSALWHLPPPRAAFVRGADRLDSAAVHAWQQAHAAGLLSYTRGPGFLRIIDRRSTGPTQHSGGRERLLVVQGVGTRVFELCDGTRTAADVAAQLGTGVQPGAVERALAAFEARDLIARDGDGALVALPLWWRALEVE
jgi:hypothetical protein